ncbi:unnamed protein product [Ectocarpus sp. CCAP 1310/34]|nr:unnamed protein product [Ectocarpus sp. CCAP 1310/34]
MEDSGSYVDPNEASDDEDDDAEFDMGHRTNRCMLRTRTTLVSTRDGQLGGSDNNRPRHHQSRRRSGRSRVSRNSCSCSGNSNNSSMNDVHRSLLLPITRTRLT